MLKSPKKIYLIKFQSLLFNSFFIVKRCLEGFNLTYDEIVTLFSALDGHKKTYVLLEDLNNKLGSFDFYTKMHIDIKNFISNNFVHGLAAFKYFSKKNEGKKEINNSSLENQTHFSDENINNNSGVFLNKKEIFDGINNLFPKKYVTPTIINYLSKNFKNIEEISFSEFNYVYFDDFKPEVNLKKNFESTKNHKDKPSTSYILNNLSKSQSNFRSKSANIFMNIKTINKLETPFDDDALEKVRRIIYASRFDFTNYFKMHEILSNNGMVNQAEFKNILKKMNIGLTSLEIDKIYAKAGKTVNGMINIKDFCKFLQNE